MMKVVSKYEQRESLLSPKTQTKVKKTCQMLDTVITKKRTMKEMEKRAFQDPDALKDTGESEEETVEEVHFP